MDIRAPAPSQPNPWRPWRPPCWLQWPLKSPRHKQTNTNKHTTTQTHPRPPNPIPLYSPSFFFSSSSSSVSHHATSRRDVTAAARAPPPPPPPRAHRVAALAPDGPGAERRPLRGPARDELEVVVADREDPRARAAAHEQRRAERERAGGGVREEGKSGEGEGDRVMRSWGGRHRKAPGRGLRPETRDKKWETGGRTGCG